VTQTGVAASPAAAGSKPVLAPGCLIAATLAGLGMAAWLPDSVGPGVFLPLVALAAGTAVFLAVGAELNFRRNAFAITGLVLVSMGAFRSAAWLVVPDLLLALAFAALAVTAPSGWADALAGMLTPAARLPQVPGAGVRSVGAALGSASPARAAQLARGLLIGGALVTVFWVLFASADRAFAELTGNLLPDWDLGLLPIRIVTFLATVGITLAFVLAGVLGAPNWLRGVIGQAVALPFRLSRTEWIAVLGLLNALFLTFGIVQVWVLFRGHDHILETAGLTYAEYARSGFLQLLAAVALTIPVVTLTWVRSSRDNRNDLVLLKALLGFLCLLTLLIVVSALRRLGLYEEAFGFTRSRLAAHAVALWLGTLLLAMLIAGAMGATRRLFDATVALIAAFVIGFSLMNPDAAIAKRNWQRYLDTEKMDTQYLSGLSSDAIPFLVTVRSDVIAPVLRELEHGLPDSEPWSSANLSRIRARQVLSKAAERPGGASAALR
jgi:hypothetical protein